MAQRRAFETVFRKDANLRKVWDDIVTGEPQWRLRPEAGLAAVHPNGADNGHLD